MKHDASCVKANLFSLWYTTLRFTSYCPSVFILEPRQYLHINKGRLYATRQLSAEALPFDDCHAKLRQKHVQENPEIASINLCVTVSWNWMFVGVSRAGVHREVVSLLECAELSRRQRQPTVTPPETCLRQMAKSLAPTCVEKRAFRSLTMPGFGRSIATSTLLELELLKGILPSLTCIVRTNRKTERRCKLKPNAWENPLKFPLDPYGYDAFYCKLCQVELSNEYYHCDGCESLLDQDFNICQSCHHAQRFTVFVSMNPADVSVLCTAHHTGQTTLDVRNRGCSMKLGPVCKLCRFCTCCSCKCHKKFTPQLRFFALNQEEELLKRVRDVIRENNDDNDNEFDCEELTQQLEERLHRAATGV
jgi:hypothetical protein